MQAPSPVSCPPSQSRGRTGAARSPLHTQQSHRSAGSVIGSVKGMPGGRERERGDTERERGGEGGSVSQSIKSPSHPFFRCFFHCFLHLPTCTIPTCTTPTCILSAYRGYLPTAGTCLPRVPTYHHGYLHHGALCPVSWSGPASVVPAAPPAPPSRGTWGTRGRPGGSCRRGARGPGSRTAATMFRVCVVYV